MNKFLSSPLCNGVRLATAGLAAALLYLALLAPAGFAQGLRPNAIHQGSATTAGTKSIGIRPNTGSTEASIHATPSPRDNAARQMDFIVAIVNSEPITNSEVNDRVRRVVWQITQQQGSQAVPAKEVLVTQVVEQLIDEKAQLQLAREQGMRISDMALEQAIENLARQNKLSVDSLYQQIEHEGMSRERFRSDLRNRLLLMRLRDAAMRDQVKITESDIDQHLQHTRQAQNGNARNGINMRVEHLLVAVPEHAPEEQIQSLRSQAQQLQQRVKAGESTEALIDPDTQNVSAGVFSTRPLDAYPALFMEALRNMHDGDVSAPIRSPAGFHILKVLQRSDAAPALTVTQNHARHILLIPNAQMSEEQAATRLLDFKRQIESGQADFASLARHYSQDGSAAEGGDLGWVFPGQFVTEFETALDALHPMEISPPIQSRFGVHLIQLLERREVELTQKQQRDMARNALREEKEQEAFVTWAMDVRGRAYVELREDPVLTGL